MNEKEKQFRDKQELKGTGEPTKTGLTFIPAVDIYENEEALTMIAELPGVDQEGLHIDLKDNQISILGEVGELTGPQERILLKEFETGRYYRQFSLSDVIDQNRISAHLGNGVLKVVLPKIEKAKPRRIEVSVE
ncbi:MAG: heat-shock protein Hsp20 [Deltaproteobacteria bacterium RBG_13_43_22]|nr:MAG: heat-shock protein Hsp20 [Deltaproteobacteria bacterium RBG_13_43_22]